MVKISSLLSLRVSIDCTVSQKLVNPDFGQIKLYKNKKPFWIIMNARTEYVEI